MTTTSKGIPQYAQTDSADIATKLNAIGSAVDGLLTVPAKQLGNAGGNTVVLPQATWTAVVNSGFGSGSVWDQGGIASSGGVYTVPTKGLYLWSHTWSFPLPTFGTLAWHAVKIQVNGSDLPYSQGQQLWQDMTSAGGTMPHTAGGLVAMNANDTLQVYLLATGNNGGSTTVTPLSTTLALVGTLA